MKYSEFGNPVGRPRKPHPEKECANCGKLFRKRHPGETADAKYCSYKCNYADNKERIVANVIRGVKKREKRYAVQKQSAAKEDVRAGEAGESKAGDRREVGERNYEPAFAT
jgi:hypothetical protein